MVKITDVSKKKVSIAQSIRTKVESIVQEIEHYQGELQGEFNHLKANVRAAKRAKAVADEARRKYMEFFKLAPAGFVILNVHGEIIMANLAAAELLGEPAESLDGKPLESFASLQSGFILNHFIENVISSSTRESCEVNFKNAEGRSRLLQLEGISIENHTIALISLVDVTHTRRVENSLLKAKARAEESDKLKTAFLQNMSHVIRTPLNAVCGFAERLNEPGISADDRSLYTSIIISGGKQLLHIIEDILTMSSLETGQEKLNSDKVNINELMLGIKSIYNQQAFEKSIEIIVRQGEVGEIYGDREKMLKVLSHLLRNAIKFTAAGYVEMGYRLKGTELEFRVKDTGRGIEPVNQQQIFKRFIQSPNVGCMEGTGLGLSICKGYVELMGGNITVDSLPGKGSTFIFTVPYKPVIQKPLQVSPLLHEDSEDSLTILIAEDNDSNYILLQRFFNRRNIITLHARNGIEAVELCRNNPAIDLVLMDIMMPEMNGYAAAIEIKKIYPALPVVALTAVSPMSKGENYQNIFDAYVTKPVDVESLLQLVRRMTLDSRRFKIHNLQFN